ncbi:PEP-utilizing enzyme [Cellulomonas sp. IC4_254]|uniref:PEP-utilizing enzyme n=1 Tax=Cellulomonas sp. IC4_254 TaxID=2714040 RepID=UPI003216AAEC
MWTLQARPVTAHPTGAAGPPPGAVGAVLSSGTPASPGTASGRVRVLRGVDDLPAFRPGEVLVCRATSPAWTPALAHAAAVVTEVGGLLSHAAIVARELGVPAVTGVTGARDLLDGALVVVDGSAGTVRLVAA